MDKDILWDSILSDIKSQVSKAVFQTLFSQLKIISFDGDKVVIGCKKPMLTGLIEKRYQDLVKGIFREYTKKDTVVEFSTLQENIKNGIEGPLFSSYSPLKTLIKNKPAVKLNPDYTFDNFAVSSSNQMAYAAATAVAKSPGVSYNPLFLYGGVGVGKTHLMQSIGHYIMDKNNTLKFICCTGEEFTNEIIEAIGNKTTSQFKKKYRRVNMLFIDDIQFIAGKYSIQEEFFHTFNAIQQEKGQIVLTSDRPPEDIAKLEARLRSRFQGGLTIDIGQPDFELRTAILLIKAKKQGIELSMDVARLLSANIEDTRRLEGILIRVINEAKIKNITLDYELVKNILGRTIREIPKKNSIKPDEVINLVADFYNLKQSQLKGEKRDRFLALPRQIIYYLLKVEMGTPLVEIGEILGGRDHTTILHGVRKISNLLSTDEKLRVEVMGIKNRLYG